MSDFTLAKIRGFPWLSLCLFCLTYGIFGWLVGSFLNDWQAWILTHQNWFFWDINEAIARQMSIGFGASLVFILMVILTAPLHLVRICFSSWLRSDTRAFISVLGWALAAVLIITWFHYFARLFVLISAGMLCHLDLQLCGCRAWQVFVVLTILSLGSYTLGLHGFMQWGTPLTSVLQSVRFLV
ncbi:hypothetical protein [[Limnothrix rosea] IAM M-220]|uniref:hypothetical protein n=1 Tax=[Limnothrix rosea] IAM M-220 TaxID=454133 RepID=UPI0009659E6D|nr:hypothetical protein [[Limnothrix rosea] IAM M-220]OKH17274.1 hypothetical protein NIES208_09990 [[Limnothrix rosea] IAM M-220]